MIKYKEFICIGCPLGCPLQLEYEGSEIKKISGYSCKRGEKYARQEFTDPRRQLSTTIAISGALWNRLPVRVNAPIPKDKVMEAVREIHKLKLRPPVKLGEILIQELLGMKEIHVIATRSMDSSEI